MAGRRSHLEREVKLRATAESELDLAALQVVTSVLPLLPPQQLRAVYFDTPDFRLFDRNITFRHRAGEESGDGVWTMKLPGNVEGQALQRTEISWPGNESTIPAECRRVLQGIVRHSELKPVVVIATTRRRFALRDAHGSAWAELDDDTVSVSGGPEDGLRFRQLELEISSETNDRGTRDLFKQVVRRLRATGAKTETQSKLAKALGSAVSVGPARRGEPLPGPQTTVADVVRASIASSLDRILNHDVLLRLDRSEPEPEDVHQTRVATRRLRSDLKTFAQVLDPVWVRHVRADLRWAGAALGRVRDADVLMDRLDLASTDTVDDDDDAGRSELRERLMEQRRQAAEDLAAALVEARYLRLLDRVHAASILPPFSGHQAGDDEPRLEPGDLARRAVARPIARSWRPLYKRARQAARNHPTDGDLHQVRIKAKQVRYASEAAASVVGRRAQRTARAAKKLQTVLGDHHDAVTAEAWLAAEARRATSKASYTAGLLAAEQRRLQKKLRHRWKAVWHDLEASTGWLPPS